MPSMTITAIASPAITRFFFFMVMNWFGVYAAAKGNASSAFLWSDFTERELPAALPSDDNGQVKIPELCSFFVGDDSCLI